MWPIRFSSVHLCIFCLLFLAIHQHALQAAPAHRSHRERDSPKSLEDPHLEFQGPNRPEDNTDHGQSRELAAQVIHHHAIQEAPAQSSHRHPDSHESVKEPHLAIQGPNRLDNTDQGQSWELAAQVIHHHAIQEAPAHSSHRHPDSHESVKDPHLEFQRPNRPKDSTDHGKSRELGSQLIHHHAIQEAPAQSSHRHPDSHESLKEPHLAFQGPNRPDDNTDHGQSRELAAQVIHHHAIQEAPAQSSHRHPDSHESLNEPHLAFQGPNRPDDNTDHGQSRELAAQVIHHHAIQEAPAQSSHRHPDSHESLKNPHLEFQRPNRPKDSTDHGQSRELGSQLIHHHGLQEAPAHSSRRHPDSLESLKDPHLEFQGQKRPEDNTDYGQSRELESQLIHHHAIQEAPAQSSHRHPDSHESLKNPHLEFQRPNRPKDSTDHGQSRELGSQLIHHHGLQEAPAHSSRRHPDSLESLKDPHLEFQGQKRPEDNTDYGQSRELESQLIHHHAIQEAPAQSSHRHPDSHESLKNPHLEFQRPNRPKDSTDHGQSRELGSQLIHHHAIQEAPAQSSHRHPDSHKSPKEPHLEFQGPNRPEDSTDRGQTREFGSWSEMPMRLFHLVSENPTTVDSSGDRNQRKTSAMQRQAKKHLSPRARTSGTRERHKELTIPLARGIVNIHGRRIANPWIVTYGDVWRDTRLAAGQLSRMPRLHLASSPIVNYYPDEAKLASVCKSTIFMQKYGMPRRMSSWTWIQYHIYRKAFTYRRMDLKQWHRQAVLDIDCHRFHKKSTVLAYLECALSRYQRNEYQIPQYPKRQNQLFYDN
ncbi:filaggrin isoform X2 [Drosophila persimilis]|uniref:filaggrin isoform X2 n=1 Tax=Drosophila persimilis TaxID=7234 RepID=UPI000F075B9C|nr:filaggrin isoform X2 [Drosophila persimilis]